MRSSGSRDFDSYAHNLRRAYWAKLIGQGTEDKDMGQDETAGERPAREPPNASVIAAPSKVATAA
jgi:hypothetical protein